MQQIDGEVGQFAHVAHPSHGVAGHVRIGAAGVLRLAGIQPRAHALGGEGAGRDVVEPNAIVAPFDRQRLAHCGKPRLRHGRGHGIGAAVPHPCRQDRHHRGPLTLRDPALAAIERDEERSTEDDIGDGVEAARTEVLGAADEVARRVVDQAGQGAAVGPDGVQHLGDRFGHADVAGQADHLAAGLRVGGHQFLGGGFDDAPTAAADIDLGAQDQAGLGHDLAEARAAAGDQDPLALHQAWAEHQVVGGQLGHGASSAYVGRMSRPLTRRTSSRQHLVGTVVLRNAVDEDHVALGVLGS